jgi:hypothetical protein
LSVRLSRALPHCCYRCRTHPRDCRRRVLEIDFCKDPRWQHVCVYFQPDLERGRGIHILLDDLIEMELVVPELIVSKGIKPEGLMTCAVVF